jgi:asparagine synthase (glutamine-hydrolysing)
MCGFTIAVGEHGMSGIMYSSLHYRGPDDWGCLRVTLPWAEVHIAMTRLKIVDQGDIPVPFRFEHLGIILGYNGEVYNWRELRAELDVDWTTECDAEVVAAAWREWGPAALRRFNGMFSFALVDTRKEEVWLARDRCGQKPLLYAEESGRYHAASEAKGLSIPIHEVPCLDADVLEYDALEDTPIEHAKRLLPGHFAKIDEELESLLLASVQLRCKADVPVALHFSGGLDSALIHAACEKLDLHPPLYCITFDEIDHLSTAMAAAPNSPIEPVTFGPEEFYGTIPWVAYHLDTPATWSSICLWQLNRVVSESGGRIVISGEGADELFGGYSRYRILLWLDQMLNDTRLGSYEPTIYHAMHGDPDDVLARLLDRKGTEATHSRAREWVKRYGAYETFLPMRLARTEFHTTMQVLLRMADRMAAAWSLENRCPFLDYSIMEFSTKIPADMCVNPYESKVILRDVARRLGVPNEIIAETDKRGLAIPWASWAPDGTQLGTRGVWDRSAFARLMRETWRDTLVEHPSVTAKRL